MSSFIKFRDQRKLGNQGLHWGRADFDGAPLRSPYQPPYLKEQEWENLAERVHDVQIGFFDINNPEQRAELTEILDKAMNQWYRVLFMDRHFIPADRTYLVYIEYAIPVMELPRERLPGSSMGGL